MLTSDRNGMIYYDPPPHSLTRGQLARTYCYDNGLLIAGLIEPPPGRVRESELTTAYTQPRPCPDPYDVTPASPAPRSPDEVGRFLKVAQDTSRQGRDISMTLPYVIASEWTVRGNTFSVKADLSDLLAKYGDGVYTIFVGDRRVDDESATISLHSIFYGVTPPDIRSLPTTAAKGTSSALPVPIVPTSTATPMPLLTPTPAVAPSIAIVQTLPLTPTPTLTPTLTSTPVPTDTPTPTPIPAGASRDNPVPLGKPGTTHDDFQIWVVEVQKDAHGKVVKLNIDESYYEDSLPGYVHILVRIRVKNLSVEPRSLSKWGRLSIVGPSQIEFQQCHTPAGAGYYLYTVPDEYDDDRLMFQDGEIEGNLCFTVKESDLDSLVMFHKGGGGWTFFALQ